LSFLQENDLRKALIPFIGVRYLLIECVLFMSTQPLFKYIALNLIKIIPKWNIHPFLDETPPPILKKSFEEVGILHPPLIQQTMNGDFNLICGRRRLHALNHYYKQSNIFCLILPPELPPRALLSYILTDQQLHAALSPMEAAFFLQYSLDELPRREAIHFFLPRLGYKPQPEVLDQLLSLHTLDQKIQRQIHQGLILEKIAIELLDLPEMDRITLSVLFELLQPGTGKQKRLLTLTRDLSNRTQQSISSLFQGQEFKQIIEHNEMNPPQKIHVLLELLQKKTYSRSSDAERCFKDKIRKLNLPDYVTVTHSLNFETDEVFLTEGFPNLQSCENAWRKKTDRMNGEGTNKKEGTTAKNYKN
jgi:hypothetical protein